MKIIEYSTMLGYLVTFDAVAQCYFIYSPDMSDAVCEIIKILWDFNSKAFITLITDEERAKQLMSCPECCKVIDDINGNVFY